MYSKDTEITFLKNESIKLKEEIDLLKNQLQEEIAIKNSEIQMNQDLKLKIENQEIIIEHLRNNNHMFIEKIAILRRKLKALVVDNINH
jgi:chaperonin cofactor prefoldin